MARNKLDTALSDELAAAVSTLIGVRNGWAPAEKEEIEKARQIVRLAKGEWYQTPWGDWALSVEKQD